MPKLTGVEVARLLREGGSKSSVLAISAYDSREYFYGLIDAGASGYLMKEEADADLIVEAVRRIAKDPDELWISPAFAGRIVRGQLRKQRIAKRLGALTDREREILVLVSTGAANAEIGTSAKLSPHTVKNHIDRMKQKLDVRTRAELVAWAWEHGLTETAS
jgi:DNA-binding NarL/FixJ family response regulator